jgi:phosphoribosylformylglycinamidine synthase
LYRVAGNVTPRPSNIDPQGQAIQHALHDLGHAAVAGVRAGKHLELLIDAESAEVAEGIARAACAQLLANPVTEDYAVAVGPA